MNKIIEKNNKVVNNMYNQITNIIINNKNKMIYQINNTLIENNFMIGKIIIENEQDLEVAIVDLDFKI